MCTHLIKTPVKSVSVRGVKFTYAPCGVCDECRHTYQNEWFFRLLAEMQECKAQGYRIGFCTLTYSDTKLPLVPSSCFPEDAWYPVPCFDKVSVRRFIKELRDDLYNNYGVKGCRYFLASEYGETTKRPHYHMLWAWKADNVDAKLMHSLILRHWFGSDEITDPNDSTKYGLVLPMHFNGADYDERRNPFEVDGDVANPCRYCAKYACKDIAQIEENDLHGVNMHHDDYRNCRCFHLQSRSFGFSAIASLTDEQKIKAVTKGMSFVGQDKLLAIPMYFKRKILFDNYYIKKPVQRKDGVEMTRFIRREPTEFFRKYKEQIFKMKVCFFTKLFDEATRPAFWMAKGCDEEHSTQYSSILGCISSGQVPSIASDYVAYYGIPQRCCLNIEPYEAWFSRYERYWTLKRRFIPRDNDKNSISLDKNIAGYCTAGQRIVFYGSELRPMYDFVSFLYSALGFFQKSASRKEQERKLDKQIDALKEFYYGLPQS